MEGVAINFPHCPVCLAEYDSKSICYLICDKGHSICQNCKNNPIRASQCPVCRGPEIPGDGIINLEVMNLIETTLQYKAFYDDVNLYGSGTWRDSPIIASSTHEINKTVVPSAPLLPTNDTDFSTAPLKPQTASKVIKPYATNINFIYLITYCENGDFLSLQQLLNKYDFSDLIDKQDKTNDHNNNNKYNYSNILIRGYNSNQRYTKIVQPTALQYASCKGHLKIVQLLLDNGADIHMRDNNHDTALHYACNSNCDDVVNLLLEKGADMTIKNKHKESSILLVLKSGNVKLLQSLLEHDIRFDINKVDDERDRLLIRACAYDNVEVIRLLLNKGADINLCNSLGWTALMAASHFGHVDIVRLLLKRGADHSKNDNHGNTALTYAQKSCHLDVLALLQYKGGTK